jgi:hypothetical protein
MTEGDIPSLCNIWLDSCFHGTLIFLNYPFQKIVLVEVQKQNVCFAPVARTAIPSDRSLMGKRLIMCGRRTLF